MSSLLETAPASAVDRPTLAQAFLHTAAARPGRIALRVPGDDGGLTWGDYAERVAAAAGRLRRAGVRHGDVVMLALGTRPDFHWWDTAAMCLGAATTSVYPTSAPSQVAWLIEAARPRVVVADRTMRPLLDGHPALMVEDVALSRETQLDLAAAAAEVTPEDLLCLIYTSGTTGEPKGVEITHANELANLRGLVAVSPDQPYLRAISFLPMAHIAARTYDHYLGICAGSTLTCAPDLPSAVAALAEVRPTQFFGVPRVWEKLAASGRGLPELGLDQCRQAMTGAAPTPREVFDHFTGIGLDLVEIWGMSEIAGVGTYRAGGEPGNVGTPLPGLEARVADDGELLVRGDMVMRGYRDRPEATAEAVDDDGWLHTGDVATITDRVISIIDRKKDLIITAGAKNVAPALVEARVTGASPLIAAAACVGDGRPYLTCLITLDPDVAARLNGRPGALLVELAEDPVVLAEVDAAVARAAIHLSRVETPRRWLVVGDQWPPGGEFMTPTSKLRRRPVLAHYRSEIDRLYEENDR